MIRTSVVVVWLALVGVVPAGAIPAAEPVSVPKGAPETAADVASTPSWVPIGMPASDGAVRDILVQHQVDTRPPRPGLGGYLRDLGSTISRGVGKWFEGLAPEFAVAGLWLAGLDPRWLWLAVAVVALILGLRLFLMSSQRRRPRRLEGTVQAGEVVSAGAVPPRDPVAAVEAGLAADDATGALEALWWWLADRLGFVAADPSWTSRELVLRAKRRDLLPIVRRFDGLVYGPTRPDTRAVRGFWQDLRGAIG